MAGSMVFASTTARPNRQVALFLKGLAELNANLLSELEDSGSGALGLALKERPAY